MAAAWLWAYSKPVIYKMAYGTDKHPDAAEGDTAANAEAACRGQPGSAGQRRGARASPELTALRADLEALEAKFAGRRPVMEVLLLGIYSFFVWLIFIKLKLLPWTTPWKVAVAIFPVV